VVFWILRGVIWKLFTDVSGQCICPIFKGQEVQKEKKASHASQKIHDFMEHKFVPICTSLGSSLNCLDIAWTLAMQLHCHLQQWMQCLPNFGYIQPGANLQRAYIISEMLLILCGNIKVKCGTVMIINVHNGRGWDIYNNESDYLLNSSVFRNSINQPLVLFKLGNCVYEHTVNEARHVCSIMFKCTSASVVICNWILKFQSQWLNPD
jgi:hypothetical protein